MSHKRKTSGRKEGLHAQRHGQQHRVAVSRDDWSAGLWRQSGLPLRWPCMVRWGERMTGFHITQRAWEKPRSMIHRAQGHDHRQKTRCGNLRQIVGLLPACLAAEGGQGMMICKGIVKDNVVLLEAGVQLP